MPEAMSVKVTKNKVSAKMEAVRKGAPEAAAKALFGVMQKAFLESQKQVPVLTGVLKNSGQLKEPEIDEGKVRIAITYGGAATKYASEQHDNVTLNHPRGGKAHFVIDPVRAAVPDMRSALRDALKGLAERGAE